MSSPANGQAAGAPAEPSDLELFGRPGPGVPPAGAACITPRGPALIALAEANRRLIGRLGDVHVGGVSLPVVRAQARRAAVEAGRAFARRFGLWNGGPERPALLIATGHQPIAAHPGIWVKNALVEALAAQLPEALALNVVVDHDTATEFGVAVPCRAEGRLCRRTVPLVAMRYGEPFSQVAAPDRSTWEAARTAIAAALASLGSTGAGLLAHLARFSAIVQQLHGAPTPPRNVAEWMTAARHRYEQAVAGGATGPDGSLHAGHYLEVPMADLATSEAFVRLFAHLAADPWSFAGLYNDLLRRYRRVRHLRSRANPFPDLAVHPDRVELPFWILSPGQRRRALHVRRLPGEDRWVLETADGPVTALLDAASGLSHPVRAQAIVDRVLREQLQIRPRAVALTLFVRLFVADLFVHGIGGGRYDRITDAIIRLYFGVTPPPYAVASMSLPLPLAQPATPLDPAALRARLRALRFNPQRFVDAADPERRDAELWQLVRQKAELIAAIAQAPPGRRRLLTRQIEAVNATLYARLSAVERALQEQLAESLAMLAEADAAAFRRYPFFLHGGRPVYEAAAAALAPEAGRQHLTACAGGGREGY